MKLSRKEKIILGNIITNNYKYIHRDMTNNLWITQDRWLNPPKDPVFQIRYRESDEIYWFGMYRHLFQTIRNGEEYSIEELLKGE